MTVVTLESYYPPPRYDAPTPLPWTLARMEASANVDPLVFAARQTISLATLPGGLDTDPTNPRERNLTTELGQATDAYWRVVWVDATGDESEPSDPVHVVPWAPSVQDIADLCPAHTRVPIEIGGQVRRRFDDQTNPPSSAVIGFIDAAVKEVESRVGVAIPAHTYDLAERAAAWHAAVQVEAEVAKEDVADAENGFRWKERQYVGCLNELIQQARRVPLRMA